MRLVNSISKGKRRVYDIEVDEVHNFYANGLNVHNCATDGGVSVIKDDGTVVDITHSSGNVIQAVALYGEWLYVSQPNSAVWGAISYGKIPNANVALNTWRSSLDGLDNHQIYHTVKPNIPSDDITALLPNDFGFTQGLVRADIPRDVTFRTGMTSLIASDYNTGWMNGDIKLATLSDTDTTNATSANMAGNGNFADTSVWFPANGASLSVSGNVGTITGNGSTTQAYVGQTVTGLTVGKQYMITCDAKRGTTVASAAITVNGVLSDMTNSTSFVPLHITFTATATSQLVLCFMNGTGSQSGTALFQNFTFRLAEADRSINGASPHGGNALQVFGTITKTAVATGADLVAYSGFSSSNYLEQPYNSDLDFGTGDFSVMGWYNVSASGILVERGNRGVSNTPGFYLWSNGSNTLRFETSANNFVTTFRLDGTLVENVWQYVTALRRSGVMYLYINGVLQGTLASTVNLTNTTAITAFGVASDGSVVLSGSLALWRISATAPTAAQIKEIYEAEKPLFQENAKATLNGTSDAVQCLAYDDSTSELVVGTSSSLSVFKGLRRVDEELGNFTEVSQQGGMRIVEKA